MVNHSGDTGGKFSGGFEGQAVFHGCVETLEKLVDSSMGDCGQGVRDMCGFDIWDKASFVCKGKRI